MPPLPGLQETDFCTDVELLDLQMLPRRLLVMGGGPIGCELAQVFARRGSEVTIIQSAPRLLPKEDPEITDILEAQFREEGIGLVCKSRVVRAEGSGAEKRLIVEQDGKQQTFVGDEILVAVGRAPNIDGLNLDAPGVTYSRHGIPVNERLQTNVPSIYAAGDVVGPYLFSHVADEQGRLVGDNVNGKKRKYNERVVPWTTFTDPEVARVGLTEAEARKQYGDKLRVLRLPLAKGTARSRWGRRRG